LLLDSNEGTKRGPGKCQPPYLTVYRRDVTQENTNVTYELWITMSPSNQKICFQHQCLCGLEDHGHEFQQLFLPPHTRSVTHESTPSVKIVTPKRKLAHKLHLEPLPPQASFQKAFLDDIALCSELFQQLFLPPLTRSVTYEHTLFSLVLFSLWA